MILLIQFTEKYVTCNQCFMFKTKKETNKGAKTEVTQTFLLQQLFCLTQRCLKTRAGLVRFFWSRVFRCFSPGFVFGLDDAFDPLHRRVSTDFSTTLHCEAKTKIKIDFNYVALFDWRKKRFYNKYI